MEFRIEVEPKRVVKATVSGAVGYYDRTRIRNEIARACTANGVRHVLVDHSESVIKMTTAEHYSYGASFCSTNFPDRMWFGIILQEEVMANTLALFSIAVAQNRGIRMDVFANHQNANFALHARLNAAHC